MNQRQMFALGFFVVLLILLYQIAIVFRPFVLPVLWAVILAHMTFPLHRRLTALLGQRKGLSAAILTVAIIGLVVVPLVIFIVQLIEEAGRAYVLAKTWIDGGGLKTAPGQLSQLPIIGGYVQPILGRLVLSQGDLETSFPYETIFGGGDTNGPKDGPWTWTGASYADSVRPSGVAVGPIDGALYVPADKGGKLYRVGVKK